VGVVLDIIFGAIGTAYLIYGKRQYDVPFLVAGFVLLIYPYFVSNAVVCGLIGVAVSASPFIVARLA
jgi:hypothetical protein